MSPNTLRQARRRAVALAVMAIVWVLFGIYIFVSRERISVYPAPDADGRKAADLHISAAPSSAFAEPSIAELERHRATRVGGVR